MTKHWIIVIAGPTGVGESTVTKALLEQLPNSTRIVTTTSRHARHFEKEGIDYHFITKEQFENGIEKNEYMEYTFIANRDNYYGTKRSDFTNALENHDYVLFNADKVGLAAVQREFPDHHISFFIMYDSLEDIRQRQLARQPEMAAEDLAFRLQNAVDEAQDAPLYGQIVVNYQGKVDETIKTVLKSIHKQCA
jgi:guanylate kinase